MSLEAGFEKLHNEGQDVTAEQADADTDKPDLLASDERVPGEFTSEHDRLNWITLCGILDNCNNQVDALEEIVDSLTAVSNRFEYISSSLGWLRIQIKDLRAIPRIILDQSDTSLNSGSDSELDSNLSNEDADLNLGGTPGSGTGSIPGDSFSQSDESPSSQSDSESESEEKMFLPSHAYDWSKIDEDIGLVRDTILMSALMTNYEIFSIDCVSETNLDDMFSQLALSSWEGSMEKTMLEILSFLSQHFRTFCEFELPKQPPSLLETLRSETTRTVNTAEYPLSPKYPGYRLNANRHEIRILQLMPGSNVQPIQGVLRIVSLYEAPRYEALSYAWGSSAVMKSIELNGTEVLVTSNLEAALLHLREERKTRNLWIDALCINQNDLEEKQQQVQLMSKIYPEAESVLCWLGSENDDSAFVIDRLLELAAKNNSCLDSSSDEEGSDSDSDDDEKERFSHGLYKLLSRPRWSRLWTCQEFALTLRQPQLICGHQTIPWSSFRRAAKRKALHLTTTVLPHGLKYTSEQFWATYETLYGVQAALTLRTAKGPMGLSRTAQFHPIYAIAIFTRRYECMDPRDKIYAILSFMTEPHQALLPPNYLLTPDMVNTKFSAASLLIGATGRLYNYLSVATNKALPSWAIDFSAQTLDGSSNPTMISFPHDWDHFFNASKGRQLQCIPIGPRLLIRGILVDTIQAVYNVQEDGDINPDKIHDRLKEFVSTAVRANQQEIPGDNSLYRLRHLRTKDSVYDIITCGLDDERAFERVCRKWHPSEAAEAEETIDVDDSTEMVNAPFPPDDESDVSSSSRATETDEENVQLLVYSISGRKLLITRSGFSGLSVAGVQEDDLVVVFFGFDVPFIIRDHGNFYQFVGAARIGGIMAGQLMKFVDNNVLRQRTFIIK